MSVFGDIFNVFAFWRTRRTNVTVEITQALADSSAPRVINLADIRPVPKVYILTVRTTNHGEQTEYMTSLSFRPNQRGSMTFCSQISRSTAVTRANPGGTASGQRQAGKPPGRPVRT